MTTEPDGLIPLDAIDPDAMDDRGARLRAELDRLDMARAGARTEALADVTAKAAAERAARDALAVAVTEARAYGATWRQVADAIPCTVSNAWKRWAQ